MEKLERETSRIFKCPATAYYIPNFVSESEEKYLIDRVYKNPLTKWTILSNRRLQNWGGIPHPKGMVQEQLPKWLQCCCEKVASLGVFDDRFPNHVLVNEYKAGQGIMPHQDGPLYHPIVSTISLGSHTVLDFYDLHQEDGSPGTAQSKFGLLLERRSLLILQDSMYTSNMHGIAEKAVDTPIGDFVRNLPNLGDSILKERLGNGAVQLQRDTRVSLTIRHVPKSVKLKLQIGKRF